MEETKFLLDLSKTDEKINHKVHIEGKVVELIPLICAAMGKTPDLYKVLKKAVETYEYGNLLRENPSAFLEKLMNK